MKKILLLVGLVLAAVMPAQAADYVLAYVNGNTTYYLARNGTSGVQRVTTFDPTTCIWHCASNTAGTTAGTLNNSNTYGYLYQTVNGTRYFLHANANALGLGTNAGANNYYRWRTNGTYVYNRYSGTYSYYINLANGVARNTTANTTSNARPYQVTTDNVAEAITGSLSTPTITPSAAQAVEYGGSVSYTASATGPTRIVPAHTTYTFNNTTFYYYNNQTYSSTDAFANLNPEVTYTWSLSGDGASALQLMSTTGENTIVQYTGSASGTTATLTVTAKVGTTTRTASVTINVTPVEPTAITATGTTVYMGNSGTVAYTLTPDYAYHRVSATSGNTGIFTVTSPATTGGVDITPVAPGEATLTLTALNSDGSNGPSTSVTVTVRDICAAPQFSFTQSGSTVLATLTTATPGATIRYTTDGTDPTPTTGTVYSAPFTVADGTNIKAIAVLGDYYDPSAIAAKVVRPMDYVEQGVSGDIVTLNDLEDHTWSYYSNTECPIRSLGPADVKITYYGNGENTVSTTNGTTPAANSWTEDATGVKVNIGGEDENTFVYHKTLERYNGTTTDSYEYGSTAIYGYTTIPNPFQVRPTYGSGDTRWRGFYKWRIKSISNGHIYTTSTKTGEKTAFTSGDYDESNMLDAEETYYFVPDGEYNMEVELEAMWARAYVTTSTNNLGTYVTGTGAYERNFHVVTSTQNADEYQKSYPLTISAYYPDGSNGGGSVQGYSTGYYNPTYYGFEATSATKFENIAFNTMNNHTINANNNDLIIGRGCTGTVNYIHGSDATTSNLNYIMRLESGSFNYLSLVKGTYNQDDGGASFSGTSNKVKAIIGCDYDRAKESNTNLTINNEAQYGAGCSFGSANNNRLLTVIVKSGTIGDVDNIGDGSGNYLYLGVSGVADNAKIGLRYITVEGGRIVHLAGGIETGNETDTAFTVRMSGGEIIGALYGAGAFAKAYGHRKYIITGGGIRGWIAGGCNGTTTTNNSSNLGVMYGSTFMYIGGNTEVGFRDGTTPNHVNFSDGGNIFGAGSGNELVNTGSNTEKTRYASVGQVYNSTVVIADNTYVQNNVFGGGNFGYVSDDGTNIHILGGTVKNNVFGGSNQRTGTNINIIMKDGLIMGGIYGGSNITGTISNDVTMHIDGGQVGTTTTPANIHGGGYGQATRVLGSVNLTLGKEDCSTVMDGVTVYGDVYGGSAEGRTNGNNGLTTGAVTNVNLYHGTIYGALYGGGLGTSTYPAYVYGPVAVKVYGGSVRTNDGTGENGSGGVFGCNNVNGAPQGDVTVDIYGTDTAEAGHEFALYAVYGGGNRSHYDGTPVVTIHGCDNLIEYVYGGGNASNVSGTNVTIWGGHIGNAFGGGNGYSVTGNHDDENGEHYNPGANITTSGTNLTIHGGTIDAAFGGSNQWGTINEDITVTVTAAKEDDTDPCTGNGYVQCPIDITELYGGGNEAPVLKENGTYIASSDITVNITSCDAKIANFFGGAKNANYVGNIILEITQGEFGSVFGGNNLGGIIDGDITLTLLGGTMVNAFGGNNLGGSITGTITVNVDSTGTECPLKVDNVYGGGNQAAYEPTNATANTPLVNFVNGTVRNAVFGGGLGEKAKISANPTVTIGGTGSKHAVVGGTRINGTKGDGNVYGGGSQADVLKTGDGSGNTSVTLTGNAVVKGNVYGGGNEANVEGNTNVKLSNE